MSCRRLSTELPLNTVCSEIIPSVKLAVMAELNGVPATGEALQALALTNYGHFTSMRVEDQHIRGYSQHLERLVGDSRRLFGVELDRAEIREYVRHALAGKSGSLVVRVTVFDPGLDLGRPGSPAEPKILVTVRSVAAWPTAPLRVKTVGYRRDLPSVKHIGLFGALWHRRAAQLAGFDDGLFTEAGFVSEGVTWNVGFFDGSTVIWPNAEVLPGVTMRLLKQVHEETATAPVHLRDLPGMRAAFATSTTVGVRPITAIDGIELPSDHGIFDTLRKEYAEIPPESL